MYVHLDGEAGRALDSGDPLLLGAGTFTTLRTYGGRLWQAEQHLARLQAGAGWIGAPWSERWEHELADFEQALRARSPEPWKIQAILSVSGRRLLRAETLDVARVGRPIRLNTMPWSSGLSGRFKLTTRAIWGAANHEWLLTAGATWLETDRGNLLVVRDGVLWTAPDDGRILPGVTRRWVLQLARELGVPVEERAPEAGPADEIYVCSTLKELAPVEGIDEREVSGPGPIGAAIGRRWAAFTSG